MVPCFDRYIQRSTRRAELTDPVPHKLSTLQVRQAEGIQAWAETGQKNSSLIVLVLFIYDFTLRTPFNCFSQAVRLLMIEQNELLQWSVSNTAAVQVFVLLQ